MIFRSECKDLPTPSTPFSETLLDALWKYGKKIALIDAETGQKVSNHDLYIQSLSVASFLEQKHFRHGDVACAVMHNCLEYFPLFLGVALQGGALSTASYSFTEYELEYQFKDSGSKMVFCNSVNFEKVFKAAHKCPKITCIVVVPDHKSEMNPLPFGVVQFADVLDCQPKLNGHKVDVDIKRDILILPYSSGTTGSPKGVMLTHTNMACEADILGTHLLDEVMKKIDPSYTYESDHDILFLPIYHIYGFCVLMANIVYGLTTVVMSHFNLELYCKTIESYKARLLKLVPPVLVLLSKDPLIDRYDLSSVQAMLSGAAPAGRELCEDVMKRLPNVLVVGQAYGMTELTAASHALYYDARDLKFGSSGKLVSNMEMRIIDPQTGKDLERNQRGEVCLRGGTVMVGYLNRPQATAQTIDDEGWLHTGDVGYVDDDGYTFIVDRLKELIKVKGYQVPPAELEDLLLTHPSIKDCAVIGVPDEASGEIPMAFVVRKDEAVNEKEVMDFVKERVSHYKQLKGGVQFIREIPKSPSGKILRRFLRDEAELIKKTVAKSKL
ncbi:hypothetical protein QR680_010180 [Steinernema hermaphroditum]|uniref:Uncharacterized protein n=1 Tax=Steinernema hermaphroditum TaxID=289476 RepID=A0AA39IQP5_9BILA|nr:hypothetical protein QR680_010180 [Steinernema hermaphroditum]